MSPEIQRLTQQIDCGIDSAINSIGFSDMPTGPYLREFAQLGKKVRSLSLLLWAAGHDPKLLDDKRVNDAAVAIEFGHRETLIADDIMDGDLERNGKPTIEASLGRSAAVLVQRQLVELAYANCPRELRWMLQSNLALVQIGQHMQEIHSFALLDDALRDNAEVVRNKSAKLEEAALFMANTLAHSPARYGTINQLSFALARVFQTGNDLADLEPWLDGDATELPSDLRNRTPTLPILIALRNLSPENFEVLKQFMQSKNQVDDARLREIIRDSGTVAQSHLVIQDNLEVAQDIVYTSLPDPDYRTIFADTIASWSVQYLVPKKDLVIGEEPHQ